MHGYAEAHVEDAHWIEACLKFRKAVAEEFERLLSTGAEGIDRRAPGGRLGVLSSALICPRAWAELPT